jgi:hypothetical protein
MVGETLGGSFGPPFSPNVPPRVESVLNYRLELLALAQKAFERLGH